MVHGDYNCCACCDRKLAYVGGEDVTTKEELCDTCQNVLATHGVNVSDGAELIEWINAHPAEANDILPKCGYEQCFYPNAVDSAFAAVIYKA